MRGKTVTRFRQAASTRNRPNQLTNQNDSSDGCKSSSLGCKTASEERPRLVAEFHNFLSWHQFTPDRRGEKGKERKGKEMIVNVYTSAN